MLFVRRSLLRPLLIGGIAAAIAYRFAVALHVPESFSFYAVLPFAQLDALCGGALLAELLDSRGPIRWKALAAWTLPAALLLHVLPLPPLVNNPLLPAAYVLPMVAARRRRPPGRRRASGDIARQPGGHRAGPHQLRRLPLPSVRAGGGRRVLKSLGFEPLEGGLLAFVLLSSLTIGVAAASWFLLERPALSLRRRFQLDEGKPAIIPAAPTAA